MHRWESFRWYLISSLVFIDFHQFDGGGGSVCTIRKFAYTRLDRYKFIFLKKKKWKNKRLLLHCLLRVSVSTFVVGVSLIVCMHYLLDRRKRNVPKGIISRFRLYFSSFFIFFWQICSVGIFVVVEFFMKFPPKAMTFI